VSDILEKLEKNRIPILLAEIGAYLHLIGRYSEKFIYAQARDATEQEEEFVKKEQFKKVCNDQAFFENTGLDELLRRPSWKDLINAFKNLDNAGELSSCKIKSFSEFIEKHTWNDIKKDIKKAPGLCKILADAHGIVSGMDKALAGQERRSKLGKQRKVYTFRATAFGYEKEIDLFEVADLSQMKLDIVKKTKKEFFEKIKQILENIETSQYIFYNNYESFVELIRTYYSKTIGETRRPINEISLYDYAHTIASLMKSNLAKMVIDGWYNPITMDFNKKPKWRILRVNVDVVGLLSKGLKIGDILGYRYEIEKTYEEIKKIIEFEYPLGNEIYRDSTGIYFTFPDVNNIDKLKSEIVDKLKPLNTLDFSLQIEISDISSRSMVILACEREKSSKSISYPHIGDIENLKREFEESQNAGGEDICPVCRIRLKPEKNDRCKKCENRYQGRAKIWIRNPQETIWLDEIADKNDRVALIVGQFDLRQWLSGEFIGTFISQTFEEWKNIYVDKKHTETVSDVCRRLGIHTISDLEHGFENLFSNPDNFKDDWKKICGSFIGIRPKNFINDFWKPIAERDATRKALTLRDNSDKAKHLIKLLFRKHSSPARIYRIWNTTQDFINETVFEKILKGYSWNSDPRRQRIKFKIEPNPDIPEGSTCDIGVDGVRFSPVCIDRQNGLFISTINLEILKKFGKSVNEIAKNLNEKRIKIKTERDRNWKNGKIVKARTADEKFQSYLPYVKIYDFPDQFMVLVPAYEALDLAEKILSEYEVQFSKVRDRLPLHLGIIAFHRKTPLYVVMDAGKRLIEAFKEKTKTELAEVISIKDIKDKNLGKSKEIKIMSETYSRIPLKWKISYSTGDPEQEDCWHPYIRVYNSDISARTLCFDYTGNGDYVVHVKELEEKDKIKIEPSYFRLLYLESANDRFGVDEDLRPIDHIHYLKKLWNIAENKIKSKEWSISQIYAYWEEVRKRRKNYDEDAFEKFVKAALINILEIKPQKDKELFYRFFQATIDGSLDLCLYWNFQIRKVKIGEGDRGK